MASLTLILSLICSIISFAAAACPNEVFENNLTDEDINAALNKHNELRALIANGKVSGQPKGVNVKDLKWDSELARKAQDIANTCIYKHVSVADPRYWYVGQNLAKTSSSVKDLGAEWGRVTQLWFNENKDFTYPNISARGKVTGHYTQVTWAESLTLGCGYIYYFEEPWYHKLYVCHYGPGGNVIGEAPYRTS